MIEKIRELLGKENEALLEHKCTTIPYEQLYLPGSDFIDRVWKDSDRSNNVLRNMQLIYNTGRLAGTGYVSILPVDQGIEHSAGASFAPNPAYFDPANIVKLAIEGGCNAVASTLGVLGSVSRNMLTKFRSSSRSIITNSCHIQISTIRSCLLILIRHLTWELLQ